MLPFKKNAKTKLLPAVNPSDLQEDWAAGQTINRKRGRKPKVLMGVNPNRPYHKDGRTSEKQEVREEKSDSESSEHGEFHSGSQTGVFSGFSVCSKIQQMNAC